MLTEKGKGNRETDLLSGADSGRKAVVLPVRGRAFHFPCNRLRRKGERLNVVVPDDVKGGKSGAMADQNRGGGNAFDVSSVRRRPAFASVSGEGGGGC